MYIEATLCITNNLTGFNYIDVIKRFCTDFQLSTRSEIYPIPLLSRRNYFHHHTVPHGFITLCAKRDLLYEIYYFST